MKSISGIRPTGKLHLGNYIGSILPALKYDADVLVAELHAPNEDPSDLIHALTKYFSNDKILLQRNTFYARTYFKLLEASPTGLLKHMPQYKEKDKNALMFTYPVLMAHDIANYDYVIVGEDQRPHIEFAKDILYRSGYKCPEPIYEGGKVMDLRHPERKMSKSNPESCLFLDDTEDVVESKIMKAVTNEVGRANLIFIYRSLGGNLPIPFKNELLKKLIIHQFKESLNEHRRSN
jgi:tryptophanyl-tRNA synthetase